MANSIDSDQTPHSDLSLHCLLRPVCPNTYSNLIAWNLLRSSPPGSPPVICLIFSKKGSQVCTYNTKSILQCPQLMSLTHFRQNKPPPHYILEDLNFSFRDVRLCDLDIPREKWLICLQTVETLIRCLILLHLIWVCAVCQLPFFGSLD